MLKRILSIMLCILLVLSMAGCQSQSAPSGGDTPEKKFKVGINNFGLANFFARIGKASLEDELTKLGCEVVATVTADVTARSTAVENMISQGCDAIIIEEGDINEIAPVMREAKEKGIIIGSMDAGNADFVDIYVSSDNTLLGAEAAKQMMEATGGKGAIVEIINDAGSMIRERKDAMHEVVSEYPDAEVKFSFVYAWPDFYPDTKNKMESLLQANPNPGDIAAVYATFDGVGVAAADSIREAGLQDSIVVVGIDGDPEAYKEMKKEDSPFIATLAQDPDTIARTCVRAVVDLLNGKEIPEQAVLIPGVLITKDNIPDVE